MRMGKFASFQRCHRSFQTVANCGSYRLRMVGAKDVERQKGGTLARSALWMGDGREAKGSWNQDLTCGTHTVGANNVEAGLIDGTCDSLFQANAGFQRERSFPMS